MENPDESKYIKRVLEGDSRAFSLFIDRYGNAVFSLILKIIPSREDAEELTQDTFVKAFRKLDGFKGDCSFSTWLYRIAYNTAISASRKKKLVGPAIDEKLIETVADEDVDSLFGGNEKENLLQELELAITKLLPDEQVLLTLYYNENKTMAEMALILGVTADNVKIRLYRTRKKLFVLISQRL